MNKLFSSDKIYISQSKIKGAGRGVFARKEIKKGEIIERCPVIEVGYDTSNLAQTILLTYFYFFGKKKERITLTLGFGSIYNHSYKPNAIYKEKHTIKIVDFIALKNIKKDSEITVNYKQNEKNNKIPLWFEV